jgi:hypothetical protein
MIMGTTPVQSESSLGKLMNVGKIAGGLYAGDASGALMAAGGAIDLASKPKAPTSDGMGGGGDSRTAMARRIDAIQGTGSTNAVTRIRDAQEALKMANLDAQTKELINFKLERAKQMGA